MHSTVPVNWTVSGELPTAASTWSVVNDAIEHAVSRVAHPVVGRSPAGRARLCVRVTAAHDSRDLRLPPEVWLLCNGNSKTATADVANLVHLPPTASARALLALAHQRLRQTGAMQRASHCGVVTPQRPPPR